MRHLGKLLMVLGILTTVLTSGCSLCTQTEYVDRVVEKVVTVPCQVRDVNCTTTGNDNEVVIGLQKCIFDLKMEASACQK